MEQLESEARLGGKTVWERMDRIDRRRHRLGGEGHLCLLKMRDGRLWGITSLGLMPLGGAEVGVWREGEVADWEWIGSRSFLERRMEVGVGVGVRTIRGEVGGALARLDGVTGMWTLGTGSARGKGIAKAEEKLGRIGRGGEGLVTARE